MGHLAPAEALDFRPLEQWKYTHGKAEARLNGNGDPDNFHEPQIYDIRWRSFTREEGLP